ncbi:DHHW family protein [Paenibacillus filicis]|uniref:DHHW family protein n=1 Tax=Paenibacillus gyeongsangnamensis TaxID=3388067 RepID=A0ABT4Q733_9BACL|nr:DHHW family protein [Paenibacillus filicis]MCZ8512682.1 DHHW family protein [Paenibacillus filicis]
MHKLNVFLFLIPLFLLSLYNAAVPNRQDISLLEKRALKALPQFSWEALRTGSYFRDYDNYFADHFAFRDAFVHAGSALKELRGIPAGDQASIVVQKGNNMFQDMTAATPPASGLDKTSVASGTYASAAVPASASALADSPAPALAPQSQAAKDEKGQLEGTESDKYLVVKDRAMSLFSYNDSDAEAYAKSLNLFAESIDPGVKVYSLLVPSAVEFLNMDKYRSLSDSQKDAIAGVNRRLSGRIVPVDAYKPLADHSNEYTYFRTDHHWTALGAYYAYRAFAERTGETAVPLSRYDTAEVPGFLGSAYAATLNKNLKKNPDTITIYKPFVPHHYTLYWYDDVPLKRNVVDPGYAGKEGGAYQVFLEGDSPWGRIETENANGKRLLVIKDSYGNPFIPFLLPHYEQVLFLDLRYFKTNVLDFVKEQGITDVLFLDGIAVTSYDGYSDLLRSKMGTAKR